MANTSGVYKQGKIVLDQSVDWPDGAHVSVVRENLGVAGLDGCVDGSVWDDSVRGVQSWLEWFDALQPVLEGADLKRFDAELRANRQREAEMLPMWNERLNKLGK